MQITAPAKINLTLRILGKRPDGYHALESVMQQLSLADLLTIKEGHGITFTCSDPALAGDDNLVVRAAKLLAARCPTHPGAHLHLEKRIPVQAGLGGGSSDAATTLAALNEFWQVRLPLDDLIALAAQLGSDVPFFLNGPAAIARGRGEVTMPLLHTCTAHVVLVKPSAGLSTPAVYGALHAPALPVAPEALHPATEAMIAALRSCDPAAIARALVNDLEAPALTLLPGLFPVRERMMQEGCLGILLCGSGSALFGICPDAETAQRAARGLRNDCPWTWAGPWIVTR